MIIICPNLEADDNYIKVSDLKSLADNFKKNNEHFLSYIFNFSTYYLTNNKNEKLEFGLNALDSCLLTQHFEEAERIITILSNDFPEKNEFLKYKYGYVLIKSNRFIDGEFYLRDLQNNNIDINKILLLRAYAKINSNQIESCKDILGKIDTNNFKYSKELEEINYELSKPKKIKKKHILIALPLSIFIPGAGQAYSGFHFDAIQDFAFNSILGYSTYASWKLEMSYNRENRNYILPVSSSIIFGVFYLTNLYNAINSAQKANLYIESQYYKNLINKFDIIINDNIFMLQINYDF